MPTLPLADIVEALRYARELCLSQGRQIRSFLYFKRSENTWWSDINPPLQDGEVPPDESGVSWWELPVIKEYPTDAALQTLAEQWVASQSAEEEREIC